MKTIKALFKFNKISLLQTLRANFKLLPFRQAMKFPIYVFKGTQLHIGKSASVKLNCAPRAGLLWFGALNSRHIPKGSRNYISVDGQIHVSGSARFSYDSKIIVGANARLVLGGENVVNHDSKILTLEEISFDYGARVGWNVQLCDSAFHYVLRGGVVTRKTKRISIGKEAWICSFCNVGRGACLPDYSILATCSLLNKDFSDSGGNLILAGVPAKIIRHNAKRIMEFVEPDLCSKLDLYFEQNPLENTLNIDSLDYENR